VLPEEDDGSVAASVDKEVAKVAAEVLKKSSSSSYYLRSCPAAVPPAVSSLIRVISNGTAQIDAIIPAIVTFFVPVSGYFLQAAPPPRVSQPHPLLLISRSQARVAKAVIVSTFIVLIWFDFYERQLKGQNLHTFKAYFDLDPSTPLEDAPRSPPRRDAAVTCS
jgi:hypothetical protein